MHQAITGRDFIRVAEGFMLNGDYGAALTYALDAQRQSILLDGNRDVEQMAGILAVNIYGMMETEVRARVSNLGIRPTEENIGLLVQEHSPHYVKYSNMKDLMSTDHSKAPLMAEDVSRLRTTEDRRVYNLLKKLVRT